MSPAASIIICGVFCIICCALFAAAGKGGASDDDGEPHHEDGGTVTTVVEEVIVHHDDGKDYAYPMGFGPGVPPPPVSPQQAYPPGMYVPQTYSREGNIMQWYNCMPPTYPGATGLECQNCNRAIPMEFWFVHDPMAQVDLCQPCALDPGLGFTR